MQKNCEKNVHKIIREPFLLWYKIDINDVNFLEVMWIFTEFYDNF